MWPFARRRHRNTGLTGELLARRYLKRSGLKILATNYRCPPGEIDLIALDRSSRGAIGVETIVFVEVKTRSSDRHTDPASAVDADKRRRIGKAADDYLARHEADSYHVRFDIVSVVVRENDKPQITHITDAF